MSLNLDIRPLIFMTTAIFLMLGVVFILMGQASTQVKGTREWAFGNIIGAIGIFLFAFNGSISDFFSLILSNTFIVLGVAYFLAGLWRFKEKKLNYVIFIGLPAFTFIQSYLFTNVIEIIEFRKILFTLAILFLMLNTSIEAFGPARRPLRIAMGISAISSMLYSFFMVLRIISVVKNPASPPLQSSPINLSIWIFTAVIQISNSIGFLMMFLYKQSMQFQSSLTGMQRFFSIMAHDLRSPIGTIAMIAGELQKNEKRDPEDQKQLVESMKDSSVNTFNLLENLLEWGRNMIGDLHPQPTGFSLTRLLNEEIDLANHQAQTKQINIRKDFTAEIFAFADENMSHTIARNLLSNAIKFTPEGGSVLVFTEQNVRDSSFTVTDTGIGMSQEMLKKITNANFVASHAGTKGEQGYGLGLSFCQNLVEANHGELSIHSELGKGSSIKVKLPAFHEGHGKH